MRFRSNTGFNPSSIWGIIGFYFVMVLGVILVNALVIAGLVWLVVTILRGMGVIA